MNKQDSKLSVIIEDLQRLYDCEGDLDSNGLGWTLENGVLNFSGINNSVASDKCPCGCDLFVNDLDMEEE